MKAFFCAALLTICGLSIATVVIGWRGQLQSTSRLGNAHVDDAPPLVAGRFRGIYHYDPMHADWLFPCDGGQAIEVNTSRRLIQDAERVNERFPSAVVRRNGLYLTALATLESADQHLHLDVRVILSMTPDRPADCRTPERDNEMAMPPPFPNN